jgi:endonuclease YncB( thermonuclease family)
MAIASRLSCVVLLAVQVAQVPPPETIRQGPLLVGEVVFKGTVTSVEDGDSIVVKTQTEQLALQIAGVDAPELSQPGGPEAHTFLSVLLIGKSVTVRMKGVADDAGAVDVHGTDVAEALIRRGMAWHCPRYSDDRELTSAEADARAARRGLWRDTRPTPPWLYRGTGACWQQKKSPSRSERPNFSGTWTTISPAERVGQRLTIRQDAVSVTLERTSEPGVDTQRYKLDGTTSHALTSPDGPVDIVAKSHWMNQALVVEARQWLRRGEEPTSFRQVLWIDDQGYLNLEVSSPQPIGRIDSLTLVLKKDVPLLH